MNQTLKDYIGSIELNKVAIIHDWLADERLALLFESYDINRNFFAKHFGVRILDYLIGVITGAKKAGDCPAMSVMLKFFEAKNIILPDVYRICDNFKKTLILFLMRQEARDESVYSELFYLFGENFVGVISEFVYLKYDKIDAICEDCSIITIVPDTAPSKTPIRKTLAFMSAEEKENIGDLVDEINEYVGRFAANKPDEARVEHFADKLQKEAYTLITYGVLDNLSDHLLRLARTIKENKAKFISTLDDTLDLLEGFASDMETWRQSFFKDTNDVDLQSSIIANISQICLSLTGDKGEEVEFF